MGSPAFSAEDALNALQRDVLLAKEKHAEIIAKADSASLTLDKQKAVLVQQEADRLIEELKKSGVAAEPEEEKYGEKPMTFLERQEAQKPARFAEKKPWSWPKFNLFSPKKKPAKPPKKPGPLNGGISDGEALYKVAVSDNKMTIQEAVEIGLANNLQARAAKKNVEVADSKLTEAKRSLFPTVQGVMEINGGKLPGVDISGRVYKGRSQKINMTQPLYYGGELQNTVKQAEENLLAAKAEYKKVQNDLVHQVRLAYYGVVKAEYNEQYQIELFEKVSRILKQVRAEKEQKLVSEIEALSVESQYYQALYQAEASKNDVLSANVALHQSLNVDAEDRIPVDLKMGFIKVSAGFNELLDRALQDNPDLRIKVFALESARYGVEIYYSKKKPHFELQGSYGMLGEVFHDTIALEDNQANLDQEKEWFLGVHGSMPLGPNSIEYEQIKHKYGPTVLALTGSEDWKHRMVFNLFDKLGLLTDEKIAEFSLLQAESDYQNVKNEVTLRLRDDYYNLRKYLIQIDSSIAKVRYQDKQNAILEYLLGLQEAAPANYIENLIEQAQNKYAFIQAVADYNASLSSLSILMGDPDYFENEREHGVQAAPAQA